MQIWAESGKSALPICNYSQILYQFLTFTQNLKRSQKMLASVEKSIDSQNCGSIKFSSVSISSAVAITVGTFTMTVMVTVRIIFCIIIIHKSHPLSLIDVHVYLLI